MSPALATIIIEVVICLISLYAAVRGRRHFWGFVVTFGIYLYYGLLRSNEIHFNLFSKFLTQQGTMDIIFLIAAISGLLTVWKVYKRF